MSAPDKKPVHQPYGVWPWLAGMGLTLFLVGLLFSGSGYL